MDKFDILLEKLNKLNIVQKQIDWAECIPEDIYTEYFKNKYRTVDEDLSIDTHRWYETSISVIKIYDRFLGIRHITNLFSKSSSCEDCFVTLQFYEMKEVLVTSYKILNEK